MMVNDQKKSHVKELFSYTAIYGIGLFLNKAVSFLLIPLYTNFFTPGELGMFNLVQSVWLFIILIYVYGMETSFIKFFIDSKENKEKAEVYSTTLILIFSTSVIFSIIIYFSSGSIANLIEFDNPSKGIFLIQVLSFLLFFDTLFRFPLLLLRAELKAKTYLYLTTLSLILNIAFNIIFIVVLKYNIEAIFYSYIISVFVTFLFGLYFTRGYLILKVSFQKALKLIFFGNKFIYIGLFLVVIDLSDRFFLKYFWGEDIVGIYSVNYKLASVMSLIIAAFKFSWTPYFLNILDNPDNKKIISDIFTYFVFAGLFLFLLFTFFTAPIAKISFWGYSILEDRFQIGLVIIPVILLSYFFSGLFANLNVAPFFSNKTIYLLMVTAIGFIINVTLNFLLIPKFQMMGAALATLITYSVMFIIIYFISQKIYCIDYNWNKIFKISSLALITFVISYIVKNFFIHSPTLLILLYLLLLSLFLFSINFFKILDLKKIKILFSKHT